MDSVVVAGSGISGLLISQELSKAKQPHTLIAGPRPDPDMPRLGESISLHGTVGLREAYPDGSRFFTSKKSLSLVLKRQEVLFDFDFSTSFLRGLGFRLAGTTPPADLIHVDRSGFDPFLYDRTVSQPGVTVRTSRVNTVDARHDRVEAIHLDDGSKVPVRYLFDATNQGRLLVDPLSIIRKDLGDRHRVVFTHFGLPSSGKARDFERMDWRVRTIVIRLYHDRDGLDAVLWSIPLPDKMSVGISLIGPSDMDDEALLRSALDRLQSEGVGIEAACPKQAQLIAFDNQYYIHDRAYGANWMIAGPAFASVWWPSGTGVGAGIAAAENAVLALKSPKRAGQRYQRYMESLLKIHESLDGLLLPDQDGLDEAAIKKESIKRNLSEAERWLTSPKLQRNPLIRFSGSVRPYLVPLLLRTLRMSHVTERGSP